jgi:hypothetical protein
LSKGWKAGSAWSSRVSWVLVRLMPSLR